jgi:type II secretory pathway component PulM
MLWLEKDIRFDTRRGQRMEPGHQMVLMALSLLLLLARSWLLAWPPASVQAETAEV